jgi:hypothetical protein
MPKVTTDYRPKASQSLPIIALLVSLFSLAVSFWTSFSPADIGLSVSSPQWILRAEGYKPLKTGKEEAQPRLMLKLTCSFSNKGARTGVIENVALKFQSEDRNAKWLFSPYLVVDDAKMISERWESLNWAKGSFYPVAVPGKQTVALTYIFFPESDLPNFNNVKLAPHRFKATVLSWAAGEEAWREQQSFTINFDQDLIDEISKGVIFGLPSVEQQQRVQSIR